MGNGRSSSALRLYESEDHVEPQILSSYQKVILRAVWRHMSSRSGQGNCGHTVLKRLLLKHQASTIKKVFQHASVIRGLAVFADPSSASAGQRCGMNEHALLIVQLLEFSIQNLDRPCSIALECENIGRSHRLMKRLGMRAEHWDLLGEAITETVREYQGWRQHRQALKATNVLISFIVDRLRTGFLPQSDVIPSARLLKMRQDTLDAEAAHEKRSKSCDAQREGRKKRRAASASKKVQLDEEQGSGSAEEKSAASEESMLAPTDDAATEMRPRSFTTAAEVQEPTPEPRRRRILPPSPANRSSSQPERRQRSASAVAKGET
ncbi:Protein GLB-26, partial [Aphelenchoides avenae]